MSMRLVILTSSRADYGIYLPLLKKLKADDFFDLQIIAFGTHLSRFYGYTLSQIEADGFEVKHKIESLVQGDSPEAIATAMGLTNLKFANLWANLKSKIDLIICLGDRYEMYAAVNASLPFNLPIAHIHAGETSLGAIDNTMRHSISLVSKYFFVSTEGYKRKVTQLIGNQENIHNVGALSLDNIQDLKLLSKREFLNKYQIDLNNPTVLTTFHPETVSVEKNRIYIKELIAALKKLDYQIVITLPNADTRGTFIRTQLLEFAENRENVYIIESFGTLGYFSCMKHCSFLLGNTSSGIIEAASFKKFVINLGDRQRGRAQSNNIMNVPVKKEAILEAVAGLKNKNTETIENIYWKRNVADQIIQVLKERVWKALKK